MDNDLLTRFWTDLVGRLTGPMSFRMIMQPIMASLFALRDGMKTRAPAVPPISGPFCRTLTSAATCCLTAGRRWGRSSSWRWSSTSSIS